jgi:D-3-phosphoglycerate dehydrogenase / 2-oxoglutarate reductase
MPHAGGASMSAVKVAHVDPMGRRVDIESEVLASIGAELVAERCRTDDEVVALAGDADVLLCVAYPITESILSRCPNLKVIVRYGVGVDNVDLEAATARNVMVCNVPDYCIDEVANHTMALLLALNRRIVSLNDVTRRGERAVLAPMGALRGETLGLIGYGRLAQAVGERAVAFGLRLVAFDPYLSDAPDGRVTMTSLEELLRTSDFVSVHVPLTTDTRNLIGADELAMMKPTAYLVSTARGGIVSEDALVDALEGGRIAGAGIDVWEREPVTAEHPLLALPQVIATPHVAYFSDRSAAALRRRVAEITVEALSGGQPLSVVNREVFA